MGQLVKVGVERGRATRKDLKIGVCGEHGGDPDSVKFFVSCGLNYVSCSPYRVPIARLAAAQAAIEAGGSGKKKVKKAAGKSKAKKTTAKKSVSKGRKKTKK